MIIQRIFNAKFNTVPLVSKTNDNNNFFYGIQIAKPLQTDTVSFQAKGAKILTKEARAMMARKDARALRDARLTAEAKQAPDKTAQTKKNLAGEERKRGVSKSTAKQIHDDIQIPQRQIHNFMKKLFSALKVSELSPKNHILYFTDRAKSSNSIVEKSATRDWNSIKEVITNMTDLNGAKIVMNYKTGKPETEEVLSQLIPLIRTEQVTLHEIELQRPMAIKNLTKKEEEEYGYISKNLTKKEQEEYDYVSKNFLDELEDVQEEVINGLETDVDKIKLVNRPLPKYTKGNYCALHLILQLNEKGSRPFELQIIGPRVAAGKPLDDGRLKFFEGKEIDSEIYGELISLWKRLFSDENKAAKDEFLRYFRDACFQLREDELREYSTQRIINRPTGLFKTVREYNLPPEYDLNDQYKIMLKCKSKKPAETQVAEEVVTKQPVKQKVHKNIKPIKVVNKIIHKIMPHQHKTKGEKIKN